MIPSAGVGGRRSPAGVLGASAATAGDSGGDDEELAAQRLAARRLLVRRVDMQASPPPATSPPLHTAAAMLLGADGGGAGRELSNGLALSAAGTPPSRLTARPMGRQGGEAHRGGGGEGGGNGQPQPRFPIMTPDGGLSDGEYVVADESFRMRARPVLRTLRSNNRARDGETAMDGLGQELGVGGRLVYDGAGTSDDAMGSMGGGGRWGGGGGRRRGGGRGRGLGGLGVGVGGGVGDGGVGRGGRGGFLTDDDGDRDGAGRRGRGVRRRWRRSWLARHLSLRRQRGGAGGDDGISPTGGAFLPYDGGDGLGLWGLGGVGATPDYRRRPTLRAGGVVGRPRGRRGDTLFRGAGRGGAGGDSPGAMGGWGGRDSDGDDDGLDAGPMGAAFLRRRLLPPGSGGHPTWQAEAIGLGGLSNYGATAYGDDVADGWAARRTAAQLAEIHELVALHRRALRAPVDAGMGLSLSYEQLLELEAHNVCRGLSVAELRRLPVRHIPVDRSGRGGQGGSSGFGSSSSDKVGSVVTGGGGSATATASAKSSSAGSSRLPPPAAAPRPTPSPVAATQPSAVDDPDAISPVGTPTRRLSDRSVDALDGSRASLGARPVVGGLPPADRWPRPDRADRPSPGRHSADGWTGHGVVDGRRRGADGPLSSGGRATDRRTGGRLGGRLEAAERWADRDRGVAVDRSSSSPAACLSLKPVLDRPAAESPASGTRDVASSTCLVCLELVSTEADAADDGESTVDWDVGGSMVGEGRSEVSGGGDTVAVVVLPPCGHAFHEGCIKRWLLANRRCPVCRAEL